MTHLSFIVPSYALGMLIPLGFGLAAWLRLREAKRKLAAVDPRRQP